MAFIGGNAGASTYDVPESFVAEFRSLEPHLDERQRRLVLAARAISLGHGGARQIARAVGVHPHTVAKGIAELASPDEPAGQLRQPGGGRKKITEIDPDVLPALLELAEPDTATRPNLQWTALSTRALAAKLQRRGHRISAWSVANLLRQHGFRLFPGSRPALRDGQVERLDQYRRVNDYVGRWLAAHQQVVTVSVGREYPSGPVAAVPDIGTDATMALAVNAIRTWCERQPALGGQLLVVADATVRATGRRPWRRAMTKLAADTGLTISVCYLPALTMRWVRISELIRSTVIAHRTGHPPDHREVELRALTEGGGSDGGPAPLPEGPPAWNYTVGPAG